MIEGMKVAGLVATGMVSAGLCLWACGEESVEPGPTGGGSVDGGPGGAAGSGGSTPADGGLPDNFFVKRYVLIFANLEQASAVDSVTSVMQRAAAAGIVGFTYTTWDADFSDLENVADALRASGRWGDGPAF